MQVITATQARANIYQLMDAVAASHEPVMLTGKRTNVVMISEEDWRGIQETIHLSGIPGMVESIKEGMKEKLEEGIPYEQLEW